MHSAAHKLRQTLASGKPVLGTFLVEFASAGAVQVLANAGFDFVMIDCEHGNFGPETVERIIEAAWGAGIPALVRPPLEHRSLITAALDAGAAGALFPAIESLAQARQAVKVSKYRPVGRRGVHLVRGHTRHQREPDPDRFMREANRDLFTLIQIELAPAVALADEIAAVEGVDGLYIGPGDLSTDLNVTGRWDAPELWDAIDRVARACAKHGKLLGCHYNDPALIPRLRELGVQVFGHNADIAMFMRAAGEVMADFRAASRTAEVARTGANGQR